MLSPKLVGLDQLELVQKFGSTGVSSKGLDQLEFSRLTTTFIRHTTTLMLSHPLFRGDITVFGSLWPPESDGSGEKR
jgi:hypothetical protein